MKAELDDSFLAKSRPWMQRVAQDVVTVVRHRIASAPPHGERDILCYLIPPTTEKPTPVPFVEWPSPDGHYRIGLAGVDGLVYARFAYQLGHEMGHVMMDPSRSNGAIETLATAMSLQVLADLGEKWEHDPPYENWKSYAAEFRKYCATSSDDQLATIPEDVRKAVGGDWAKIAAYLREKRRSWTAIRTTGP